MYFNRTYNRVGPVFQNRFNSGGKQPRNGNLWLNASIRSPFNALHPTSRNQLENQLLQHGLGKVPANAIQIEWGGLEFQVQ